MYDRGGKKTHGKLQLLQWAFQSARATAVREQMEGPTDTELCCLFNTITSSFQSLSGDLKCKTTAIKINSF